MEQLWQVLDVVRRMRTRLRFGELSRAPLRLLQLKLREDHLECDWIARAADSWDAGMRTEIRERNTSLQALQDALSMCELLFSALPGIQQAELRAFRQSAQELPELIISGTVARHTEDVPKVRSLAMQAKLRGFQFCLEGGALKPLDFEMGSDGA